MTARGHCPLRDLVGTSRDTRRSRVPIVGTPTDETFAWERRRELSDFLVFSNLIYIAIGAVYATKGRPGAAAIVTLSGLTSFVYHVSRETVARVHTLRPPARCPRGCRRPLPRGTIRAQIVSI